MDIKQQVFLEEREKRQIEDIYNHSFSASEREDFSIVEKKVKSGELILFTVSCDMQVVGFGVVSPLSCRSACLFEYLAVRYDKRSSGIGSKLLSHIIMALSSDDHTLGMLLEVEPIEGAPPEEVGMREKRVALYESFGAKILDISPSYFMPDLSGSGYIPMLLMWMPVKPNKLELSKREIGYYVTKIYIDVYGTDPNNKQLMFILDGIE